MCMLWLSVVPVVVLRGVGLAVGLIAIMEAVHYRMRSSSGSNSSICTMHHSVCSNCQ